MDTTKPFSNISYREKIGQLFSPAAFINDTDENIKEIERLITDYGIGGLTFFHSRQSAAANYGGKLKPVHNEKSYDRLVELIRHYQSLAKHPLLISIDAEWGLAMRVENTPKYPYALTMGAINPENDDLIHQVGYNIGKDCRKAGIHLNLAPVVDINENPDNPVIGYRSFGEDKVAVTTKALAFYKGLSDAGVAGCLKHFPGHGNTSVDSHLSLPLIEKNSGELYENEMFPFSEGIKIGVDTIMVGHLSVPALTNGDAVPASLSPQIIKGILKDKMGFKGVVISDALNMQSVANNYAQKGLLELTALNAGNDLLCFSTNVIEAIDLIEQQADKNNVDASFERIKQLKLKFCYEKPLSSEIPTMDVIELREKIAREAISLHIKAPNTEALKNPKFVRTAVVNILNTTDNKFSKTINSYRPIPQYDLVKVAPRQLEILEESLRQYEQLIFAIYVPSPKPENNYGLEPQLIEFLHTITSSIPSVVCIFGNPYCLNSLKKMKKAEALLMVYQDFPEFEKAAADLLFGQYQPAGKLPITVEALNASSFEPVSPGKQI